jgi:hypothetical protein
MANYILVCSDEIDSEGFPVRASDSADIRLRERRWPLYRRTKHRRAFANGDRLVIYVGGNGSKRQSFVATTEVVGVTHVDGIREPFPYEKSKTTPVATWLELGTPAAIDPPKDIKLLLPKLSFAPRNLKAYGSTLIGGVRAISDKDWFLILGKP